MSTPAVVIGDDRAIRIEDDDLLVEGVDDGSGEGFADAQGLFRSRAPSSIQRATQNVPAGPAAAEDGRQRRFQGPESIELHGFGAANRPAALDDLLVSLEHCRRVGPRHPFPDGPVNRRSGRYAGQRLPGRVDRNRHKAMVCIRPYDPHRLGRGFEQQSRRYKVTGQIASERGLRCSIRKVGGD